MKENGFDCCKVVVVVDECCCWNGIEERKEVEKDEFVCE
jgi:hypothetical protein